MESVTLFLPKGPLMGSVKLPQSKSLLNRYQVLQFLYPGAVPGTIVPDSEDAQALFEGLKTEPGERAMVGPAGTALRFLTAVFAILPGERILSGDARLNARPLAPLVEALRVLGASITCLEDEGHAPLSITGDALSGGRIEVSAGVSSQFLSALAMIAPKTRQGIEVEWKDQPVSEPYLTMTLKLMEELGCQVERFPHGFSIKGPVLHALKAPVELDWSAAGMFYALAAVSSQANLLLKGLHAESLQGDSMCVQLFEKLGVQTTFTGQGAQVQKAEGCVLPNHVKFNFLTCPDLAQPFAIAVGLLGIGAELTGLQTLQGKETNRLDALQTELKAMGIKVDADSDSLHIHRGIAHPPQGVRPTYGDHRMAMALAAAGMRFPMVLSNPEVVGKSFPGFWNALRSLGFQIKA